MQGERVNGMRGAKERSVLVIFVSRAGQALQACTESTILHIYPRLASDSASSRITRWRPDANRITLSSCLSCPKR